MVDHQNVQAGDAFAGAFQNAFVAAMRDHQNLRLYEVHVLIPESTEAMCAGVDTRVDGQGRANRPGQVPIDGNDGGPQWPWRA